MKRLDISRSSWFILSLAKVAISSLDEPVAISYYRDVAKEVLSIHKHPAGEPVSHA